MEYHRQKRTHTRHTLPETKVFRITSLLHSLYSTSLYLCVFLDTPWRCRRFQPDSPRYMRDSSADFLAVRFKPEYGTLTLQQPYQGVPRSADRARK